MPSIDLSALEPLLGNKVLAPLIYSAGALIVIAAVLVAVTPLISSSGFSLAFAIFFYLIVPGYCILLNFESLDGIERVLLGIPVSVALLPILQYFLNQMGVLITLVSTSGIILVVSGAALLAWHLTKNKD